ncbi:hypothetical protein Tco_0762694 [Tanacetum coccineum]
MTIIYPLNNDEQKFWNEFTMNDQTILHKEPFFYSDDKQNWLLKIAWVLLSSKGLRSSGMSVSALAPTARNLVARFTDHEYVIDEAKEMVSYGRKSDFWVGDGDFQDIHEVRYEDDFVITPLGIDAQVSYGFHIERSYTHKNSKLRQLTRLYVSANFCLFNRHCSRLS